MGGEIPREFVILFCAEVVLSLIWVAYCFRRPKG